MRGRPGRREDVGDLRQSYNGAMSRASLVLPANARRAFDRQAADLGRVLQDRFVAFVASTRTSGVAFASAIRPGDLDALGALAQTWHHDGVETPLLLTIDEFRRSLDTFPVEYQALLDHHVVIAGVPPFTDVVVAPDHLRRACEVQAKSHLLHLRQGWIDAAGHDDRLAGLVVRSAAPLRALLANVARLEGHTGEDGRAALAGARAAGLSEPLVQQVLALEAAPEHARHLVRQLPDYLAASEHLWAFVDAWHAR
jgi:hypothetical protein